VPKIKISCREALAIAMAGYNHGFRIPSMYKSSLSKTERAIKRALFRGKWRAVNARDDIRTIVTRDGIEVWSDGKVVVRCSEFVWTEDMR